MAISIFTSFIFLSCLSLCFLRKPFLWLIATQNQFLSYSTNQHNRGNLTKLPMARPKPHGTAAASTSQCTWVVAISSHPEREKLNCLHKRLSKGKSHKVKIKIKRMPRYFIKSGENQGWKNGAFKDFFL